jgi:hypothetical protein
MDKSKVGHLVNCGICTDIQLDRLRTSHVRNDLLHRYRLGSAAFRHKVDELECTGLERYRMKFVQTDI